MNLEKKLREKKNETVSKQDTNGVENGYKIGKELNTQNGKSYTRTN